MSAGVFRPVRAHRVDQVVGRTEDAVRRYAERDRVLFYREGVNASVCVTSDSTGLRRLLKIGGKVDASTGDMLSQVLVGTLPSAIAPQGARAAVVGLGSGVTVAAALAAGVGPVEVMEIEPAVVEASRFFDEPGRRPLDDPRVRLIVGDARTRLFHTRETFDVIISEPSNPWLAGVNSLFTVDFYRRVRERLAPEGIFCQWIQLYELAPETAGSLLASFLEVFPAGHAFYIPVAEDLFLVATPPEATLPLERLRVAEVGHQLWRARQVGPESVAAWYACPFDSLRALTHGAPLNRDDHPVVEFRAPRDLYRVGWVGATSETGTTGPRVPMAGWKGARTLFADWPPHTWYVARIRQLLSASLEDGVRDCIQDAAAAGMPDLAEELTHVAERERRRLLVAQAQRRARDAAMAGRTAEARDLLQRTTRVAPENGLTWALLAETERLLGNDRSALEAAARAATLGDSSVRSDARVIEGRIALARGQAPAAVAAGREAVRWDPSSEDAWLLEALALRMVGDVARAAEVCRQGVTAASRSERLRALLAELTGGR
jgi:spermidine synthase